MAVRTPTGETDYAPWALAAALPVAVIVWLVWRAPAPLVLWGLGMFAGWLTQPPILTGRKDKTGRIQPAHPGEARAMRRHQMLRDLRFGLLTPDRAAIGWPPLVNVLTAAAVGVACWFLPLAPVFATTAAPLFPLLDAWAGFMLTLGLPALARAYADDMQPRPGVSVVDAITTLRSRKPRPALIAGSGALLAAGVVVIGLLWLPQLGAATVVASGVAVLFTGVQVAGHHDATAQWRADRDARAEWGPRWEVLKIDPAPRLIGRRILSDGAIHIDTFDAPPEIGAKGVFPRLADFETVIDPSSTIALLTEPSVDTQGQPVEGTAHPTRFRAITWNSDGWPDLNSVETDEQVARLALESVAARTCNAVQKLPPLVLTQLAPITDPPSEQNGGMNFDDSLTAYGAMWVCPMMPDASTQVLADLGIFDRVGAELGVEMITDPENDCVYLGALTSSPDRPSARIQPHWTARFAELEKIRRWDQRWTDIVKQGGRKPVLQPSTERTQVYEHIDRATGAHRRITVGTWGFVTPQGVTPKEFSNQETEHKLRTTLKAAPFASVQPWKDPASREGRAHAEALMVVSVPAGTDLPTLPQDLTPSRRGNEPQRLLLAGFMNHAFDAAKLGRSHLFRLSALTAADSSGTIWKMEFFLADGVTLDALRRVSDRIRQTLGAEWLIVDRAGTGQVTIVAGADPGAVGIVFADDDAREFVSRLSWEQTFLAAKVVSETGVVPQLLTVSTLPHNEQVADLTFRLPLGLAASDIREKTAKLRAASGNDFIDIRDSEEGPDHVRMLVCRQNPLPSLVPYDFDLIDSLADSGKVPFAMGVEGEPVIFDPKDGHAMLAGVSGAGKSVLAQTFITSAAAHDELVYIIDPMKGGADFNFVRPYASAFADSIETAAAALKCVYAQVVERKNLNAAHGVPSFTDLPAEVRPQRIWVLIDEFTSLLGKEIVPDASNDPEQEAEREHIIRLNQDKATIGVMTGKIAREARSAGVTLLLGTQKLSAKTLDAIPGGDLKTNLARTLLGKASYGDRMSALRNPDDAPDLGSFIPKGRGLWEPLVGPTQVVQSWFAPQDALATEIAARRAPLPEAMKPDLSQFTNVDTGQRLGVLQEFDGDVEIIDLPAEDVIEDAGVVDAVDLADDLASFFAAPQVEPEPQPEALPEPEILQEPAAAPIAPPVVPQASAPPVDDPLDDF